MTEPKEIQLEIKSLIDFAVNLARAFGFGMVLAHEMLEEAKHKDQDEKKTIEGKEVKRGKAKKRKPKVLKA